MYIYLCVCASQSMSNQWLVLTGCTAHVCAKVVTNVSGILKGKRRANIKEATVQTLRIS